MNVFWLWFFGILLALGLSLLLFFKIWGSIFHYARHTVTLKNLPREFDGFSIAVISDLHDRRFGKENRRLVDAICKVSPDILVTAGDMHEGAPDPEPLFSVFSALSREGIPPLYVQGNHDVRRVTEEEASVYHGQLAERGAVVLVDESYPVLRNGKCLMFYGQSWASIAARREIPMEECVPSVAVCHDPLQFDRLETLPDLMISGHVHGGIFRLPFLGPIFSPGNGTPIYRRFGRRYFFPKYSRGIYQKGEKHLAVTQGLGYFLIPVRFLRPEIMIITLKSEEKLNIS